MILLIMILINKKMIMYLNIIGLIYICTLLPTILSLYHTNLILLILLLEIIINLFY